MTRSLSRNFAVLSLITIAIITAVQIAVQWVLFRDGLLDWERGSTSETIRTEAFSVLSPADFSGATTPETQGRFTEFFRRTLSRPEILRVKLYAADRRVVWSDEPRLIGARFLDNASLDEALGGATVARLHTGGESEHVYEQRLGPAVELYVPLAFPSGTTPGTARIAGVVEVYKDRSRMFANLARDRSRIVGASLAGALVLYGALFWIVHRASRQLETQRNQLSCQASALQRANDDLRAAQRQLAASERLAAIGEVSATVAHGIRNPLASIRASAQVALEMRDDIALESYLKAIVAESDRLAVWLRRLLDGVRPFEPRLAAIDVNGVVDAVVGSISARSDARGVSVSRLLATDLPAVQADDVHLQQALMGIIENAVDAVAPGGHVEVSTECTAAPAGIRIVVRDDGAGIAPERLASIFEPFVTTKREGTGLGLAIARKVVERHGGRIMIASQPGLGTTVTVALPSDGQPARLRA